MEKENGKIQGNMTFSQYTHAFELLTQQASIQILNPIERFRALKIYFSHDFFPSFFVFGQRPTKSVLFIQEFRRTRMQDFFHDRKLRVRKIRMK